MTTYKGTPITLTVDFSAETLQARREWHDILKVMEKIASQEEHSIWQSYPSVIKEKERLS